jgi:predicted acylesterase/phospholipase RssA
MTIKHLVISGGGQTIVQSLGAIYHLSQQNYLSLDNIETIYGTSAGAILGAILALRFDFETVNNYLIKRPWHKIFPFNIQLLLDAYSKKGFYDRQAFVHLFKPLFDVKDISLDITLKEFYELTNVNLHVFAFEVTNLKKSDISYITHPDLPLLQALHMSCALPVVFSPVFLEGKCYIDGGMDCNYPLQELLDAGYPEDEVIGFCNKYKGDVKAQISEDTNLINFVVSFLFKVIGGYATDEKQKRIVNEVRYPADNLNVDVMMNALTCAETRQMLFKSGEDAAASFLLNQTETVTVD